MFANFDMVHPDFGKVIYSAKAENDHSSLDKPFCRNLDVTLIPCLAIVIAKSRVGLPGCGDLDLGTTFNTLYFGERKIPLTIQGDAATRGQKNTPKLQSAAHMCGMRI